MGLSKDVLLNFHVDQTECKIEENTVHMHIKLFIILLLHCISGNGGGGGGVSMTHCKARTRVRTLVNRNERRLSNEKNEIDLKYIYVGDANCGKGISDYLSRTPRTNTV